MKEFKDRLEQRLKELDLNYAELSRRTGMSQSVLSQYKNGRSKPNAERTYLIAKALNVSEAWLLGYDVAKARQTVVKIDSTTLYNAPLYESVSAGIGTTAVDEVIDYVPVIVNSKDDIENTFCLKVRGDSMSPKIEDGDIIQVHKQTSVDSGDVAVVLLDGIEGFVKKIEYDYNYIRLVSLNMNYPVITLQGEDVQRFQVIGKVKKVMRDI